MAVFNRLAWGVLYVVLLSTIPALSQAETYYWKFYAANSSWPMKSSPAAACAEAEDPDDPNSETDPVRLFSHTVQTSEVRHTCFFTNADGVVHEYYQAVRVLAPECPEGQTFNTETQQCETTPECTIPAGTEMGLSVDYMMGATCYSNCVFNRSGRGACTYLDNGDTSCWSKYTSTGNYCDDDDGTSARPFSDHTDENGCYRSTADGKAYCEKPNDYQCPNYVMVDGKKYCRETNEDDWDSDGDGNPDSSDPAPGDPNVGGDDGNGGDPGGDTGGDDGSGDPTTPGGDGESSGGEYGQGVCEPGQEITEPKCEPHLDAIQCGIFLNSWNLRCDEKQRHEEFIGTEEFRQGDTLTDSDNPANTVTTKEVSFSGFLDGLDDSGSGFGGAMTCPPDKQINLGFGSITLPFTYICQWAEKIRPLIIALGWLAAGLIALKAMSEKE